MFGYYDVFSPQVKFLGTSVWENTRLNRESTLIGSWYPAMSRTHNAYFNKKYHALFNEYPQSLYAFAYDAVALASALARNNPADIDAAITTGDGFVGISGMFRILPDGKNEHSLDIIEVTRSGRRGRRSGGKEILCRPARKLAGKRRPSLRRRSADDFRQRQVGSRTPDFRPDACGQL